MKFVLILLFVPIVVSAQTRIEYVSQVRNKPISAGTTLPSSCTVTGNLFTLTTTNQFYVCNAGVYVIATASATLTPPVAISGSTSGNLVTITQSGAGEVLDVTGLAVFHGTGVIGQIFKSTASTYAPPSGFCNDSVGSCVAGFKTANGEAEIFGNGDILAQSASVTTTFNSLASTHRPAGGCFDGDALCIAAVQRATGEFKIFGSGDAQFQLVHSTDGYFIGAAPGTTYGLNGSGVLTVASCTGCGGGGGGTPAGSTTEIQYNNAGAFGASANLSWNNSAAVLNVGETTPISGIRSPVFSALNNSTHNPSFDAFTTSDQSAHITGAGNILGQSLAVTHGVTTDSGVYGIDVFPGQVGAFTGSSMKMGANNGTTATAGDGAEFNKSGSAIAVQTYDSGGSCGIGTGAPSPGILCSSDARLKTPGVSITDGLDAVMRLRPVTYTWKANGAKGTGYIAQEVQQVLPNLVVEGPGPDHYLMLSESGVVPYLVKAVQELQTQIDDLKRGPANRTNAEWRAQR